MNAKSVATVCCFLAAPKIRSFKRAAFCVVVIVFE